MISPAEFRERSKRLLSGYNCEPQTASIDFEMTAVLAHKARNLKRKRSTNLAYLLAMDIDEIAMRIERCLSSVYRRRKTLSIKLKGLKE